MPTDINAITEEINGFKIEGLEIVETKHLKTKKKEIVKVECSFLQRQGIYIPIIINTEFDKNQIIFNWMRLNTKRLDFNKENLLLFIADHFAERTKEHYKKLNLMQKAFQEPVTSDKKIDFICEIIANGSYNFGTNNAVNRDREIYEKYLKENGYGVCEKSALTSLINFAAAARNEGVATILKIDTATDTAEIEVCNIAKTTFNIKNANIDNQVTAFKDDVWRKLGRN